ncbi:hypothetical protein B5G09_13650 [Alistipes sp. An54]|uniref:tyrosine-type recombinase/integrase n=1 Tax=Alistipes sp. An54 TaxID=1965645 RepID=UPI000B38B5CF|nr:tyrosine-type recombinase/integrase [Alistipes sp. An54]OUN73610.1 hypothetical protein B5G09_13650 [Alistipes sp. An54]
MENHLIPNHLRFCCRYLQNAVPACFSHCARHTFATLTLASGATIDNVAKMLGHANVNMTRRYAKVLDSSIMRDMEVVAENMAL